MYKNPIEFRKRFKAYKEGKSVSEIYDAGLPKYGIGKLSKSQIAMLDRLYDWGKSNGYDMYSIAGMAGNAMQESSLNPDSISKSGYTGLWMNNKSLTNAIIDLYGDNSLESQLKYANRWNEKAEEITKGKHADWTAMNAGKFKKKGYTSAEEASNAWMKLYERPVILDTNGKIIGYQQLDKRILWSNTIYDYLNSKYGTTTVKEAVPPPIITRSDATRVHPIATPEQYTTPIKQQEPYVPPTLIRRRESRLKPLKDQLLALVLEDSDYEFPFLESEPKKYDSLYYAKNGKLPKYTDGKIKDMKLEDEKDLMWYAKPFAWKYITDGLPIDTIRERLYNNLIPVSYKTDKYPWVRARDAIVNNEKESLENFDERQRAGALARDEIYAQYLHIPKSKRRGIGFELEDAKYRPTLNDKGEHYYSINFGEAGDEVRKAIINNAMKTSAVLDDGIDADGYSDFYNLPGLLPNQVKSSIVLNDLLGWHRVGRAIDPKKGDYISYWDRWDLTPVGRSGKDLSMGIGTPVNIYDRIYLDDYYGVDSSATKGTYYGGYLPEIEILPKHNNGKLPEYKDGKSPIHIKPANRGKLTRLKARTGKSESELYNDGNPAHKKMVVFARNARKWKH